MLLGSLTLWKKIAIAALAVTVVAGTAAFFTSQYKEGQHAKVLLEIERRYSAELEKEAKRIIEFQVTIANLQTRLEASYVEADKRVDEVLNHYRNYVNAGFRLRDPAGQTAECSANGDSGTADSGDSTPSGRELSREASEFLLEFASDADRVVNQLKICQEYSIELRDILNRVFQ
jgi:hypothetical protein